jgi:chromosomal replication initiator protein
LLSVVPATASQLWEATLSQLTLRVTRQNYDTWLRSTVGLRYEGTTLVVSTPNDLTCDWLSTRMKAVVAQSMTAVAGPGLSVRYEPSEPVVCGDSTAPLQPSLLPNQKAPLNPRFTFTSFMEAGFNRLGLSAAHDIADGERCTYSPLFITGGSGMGKTHLLHAIAHEAAIKGTLFLLVGAEQFLSEFTTAIRNKGGAAFRARYREVDLLLVDDVHTLLGKKATLNEFYQTLASLHDLGKRVAVAGDPSAMSGEAVRFQSYLNWGLVAPIDQPAAEDRIRFIDTKARSQGMTLPDEVQHYLALRVRTCIRDLEGAVNRVSALSRISPEPLTINFTARALQPVSVTPVEEKRTIPPANMIEAVARQLEVASSDIRSQKRARALTYARHVAMYLLRQDSCMTYAAIARLMNKKDHSTIVHAYSQLEHELKVSPSLRADIDAIRANLHIPVNAA